MDGEIQHSKRHKGELEDNVHDFLKNSFSIISIMLVMHILEWG